MEYKRCVDRCAKEGGRMSEYIYWKEQCEYCVNSGSCPYPENQEAIKSLEQWEKENKFWGSLKLICDYFVLNKHQYYSNNPPECAMKK